MRNFYIALVIAVNAAFMVGCQTGNIDNPFANVSQTSDEKITTAVLESMLTNEQVSNLNIHVQTANGIVMLSGYVKTIRKSDTSEDIARKTPGVKSVQNNIIVRK